MSDAMMQMRSKSVKFTQIFSYQSGAVTTLPPLQESRPEILGLSEKAGCSSRRLVSSSQIVSSLEWLDQSIWRNEMEQNEVLNFPRFRNGKRLGGRRPEDRLGHQFHSEPSDGACYSSFSAGVYSYEPY